MSDERIRRKARRADGPAEQAQLLRELVRAGARTEQECVSCEVSGPECLFCGGSGLLLVSSAVELAAYCGDPVSRIAAGRNDPEQDCCRDFGAGCKLLAAGDVVARSRFCDYRIEDWLELLRPWGKRLMARAGICAAQHALSVREQTANDLNWVLSARRSSMLANLNWWSMGGPGEVVMMIPEGDAIVDRELCRALNRLAQGTKKVNDPIRTFICGISHLNDICKGETLPTERPRSVREAIEDGLIRWAGVNRLRV